MALGNAVVFENDAAHAEIIMAHNSRRLPTESV
jgi:hypothetical protein